MQRRDRGNAVVEVAFLLPWIFLLFIAVFDFGFYAYSAISVENAARVAALHTSSSAALAADSDTACFYALQELQNASNVAGLSSCSSPPLQVTARSTTVNNIDASQVTVTYESAAGIAIPWFPGRYSITRTVSMRNNP